MPERVVVGLEAVEVEQHEQHGARLGVRDGGVEVVHERAAVRQSGQAVGDGVGARACSSATVSRSDSSMRAITSTSVTTAAARLTTLRSANTCNVITVSATTPPAAGTIAWRDGCAAGLGAGCAHAGISPRRRPAAARAASGVEDPPNA